MNELAARIGEERAALVSRKAGGRRLAIPGTLADSAPLEARFGRKLAVVLVLHFGGQTIYVPHGGKRRHVDRAAVVRLTRKGRTASEIVAELQCSDRTVYSQRAKARELGELPA